MPIAPEAQRTTHVSGVIYPPQDPGIPVHEPQTLFADQHELMAMLKLHAAATPEQFAARFCGPIERVAEFVNVLPGSASASFSGAGGLFRAAVETSFSAFRASDGRIFTGNLGVEDRHRLEGRWRYVCFAAGLLYPLGGALASMAVLSSDGRKWSCELEAATAFAAATGTKQFYVTWLSNESALGPGTLTGTFALSILGRENVEWLNEGSPELVRALINIVTGSAAGRDLIAAGVVKDMWQAVNARELARRYENYGRLTIGSDVSPYVLDALISLATDSWSWNERTMYADRSGIYLEWPAAGLDIIDYCRGKGYPGIPANEAALLAILTATKVVTAGIDGVALVAIADAAGEVKSAVHIHRPALLLKEGQTLEDISAGRPVVMAAIEAADPLHEKPVKAAAPAAGPAAPTKRQSAAAERAAPTLPQIDPEEVLAAADASRSAGEESPRQLALETQQEPATATETRPAQKPRPIPPKEEGPLAEGPEVRYRDLLPADVIAVLPNYYQELLGRLVHAWKTRKADAFPRKCDQGAAFEYAMLADITRDPATFLTKLGELGMLYVVPTTPNKMWYPVPLTSGSQTTAKCFILADHAMRRLGL